MKEANPTTQDKSLTAKARGLPSGTEKIKFLSFFVLPPWRCPCFSGFYGFIRYPKMNQLTSQNLVPHFPSILSLVHSMYVLCLSC